MEKFDILLHLLGKMVSLKRSSLNSGLVSTSAKLKMERMVNIANYPDQPE